MNRLKKEWIKDNIEKLDDNEHRQIFAIVTRFTETFTKTDTGILVSTEHLTDDCLVEIEKYILFCIHQHNNVLKDDKNPNRF